jgi:hypothetical protein
MEWLAYLPAVEMTRIVADGETVARLVFQVAPARVGLISIAGTTLTMIVGSLLFPDRPVKQSPSSIQSGDR